MKKYGWSAFTRKTLAYNIYDIDILNKLEEKYIELYNSIDSNIGYNKTPGGYNHSMHEDTKRRISNIKKGISFSNDHKESLSKAAKDRRKKGIRSIRPHKGVQVKNIKDGKVFTSISVASEHYGIGFSKIRHDVRGDTKNPSFILYTSLYNEQHIG